MEDPNKIHERVAEIQKNIKTANTEDQINMLNELVAIASKIEQSLTEIVNKIEDEE